jgi:hypothetical protein
MNSAASQIIQDMATTTISFYGDVVYNLWPLFLSIGVLAFAAGFILRKLSFGRK